MKKNIIITCAATVFTISAHAQDWLYNGTNLYNNPALSDKVGIGTSTPDDKLSVNGTFGFKASTTDYRYINGRSTIGLSLFSNESNATGSQILLTSFKNGGEIQLYSNDGDPTMTYNPIAYSFFHRQGNGVFDRHMTIRKDGKVGIGTSGPLDKLSIAGNLGFETSGTYRYVLGRSTTGLTLFSNIDNTSGSQLLLNSANYGGDVQLYSAPGTSPDAFSFFHYQGSAIRHMVIQKDGKVGIGANPIDRLTVNGALGFWTTTAFNNIYGRSSSGLVLYGNGQDGFDNSSGLVLKSDVGDINMIGGRWASSPSIVNFMTYNGNGNYSTVMQVLRDGKVAIGNVNTATTNEYRLYVEKGILTERVRVALTNTSDWADYVFADNYELKPLAEVADFIKENKHLPDVPSAEEVVETGIDMAKMDAKLLQKIEELTLYVIQQQKEIDALKKGLKK